MRSSVEKSRASVITPSISAGYVVMDGADEADDNQQASPLRMKMQAAVNTRHPLFALRHRTEL
jgi:hypothetical protein